ncbi:hypothetical protein V8E55_005022 [Tylopilus felleus]
MRHKRHCIMYATLSIQGFAFVVLLVCTDDLVEAIHFASSVRHGGPRRFARGKHICCLNIRPACGEWYAASRWFPRGCPSDRRYVESQKAAAEPVESFSGYSLSPFPAYQPPSITVASRSSHPFLLLMAACRGLARRVGYAALGPFDRNSLFFRLGPRSAYRERVTRRKVSFSTFVGMTSFQIMVELARRKGTKKCPNGNCPFSNDRKDVRG